MDLSIRCDFVSLVQRFGFTPDSSGETINRKADFMCQVIRALLQRKIQRLFVSDDKSKRRKKKVSKETLTCVSASA